MKTSPKPVFAVLALIAILANGCSPAAAIAPTETPTVIVAKIASATPRPTIALTPSATVPSFTETKRQSVAQAFTFVAPSGYSTEIKKISAEIDHPQDNVFFTLAIIGAGDDERTARGLLNDIFAKFQGLNIGTPNFITVGDMVGEQADFNGILPPAVVSGTYAIIDLQNGVGLLAFGFGNVTKDFDSWLSYGKRDFILLLQTVQIADVIE